MANQDNHPQVDPHANLMFLLGEIKGQITGFIASQAAQDLRLSVVENKIDSLTIKVLALAGLIGGGSGYLSHFLKG